MVGARHFVRQRLSDGAGVAVVLGCFDMLYFPTPQPQHRSHDATKTHEIMGAPRIAGFSYSKDPK